MTTQVDDIDVKFQEQKPEAPRKRNRFAKLIPLIAVLAGIVVLLYPVLATNYNNVKQKEFADQYNSDVVQMPETDREDILEAARDYNDRINGVPILDPWLNKVAADPGSEPYLDYESQLASMDVMARVRVPSVDINLPVYHDTTPDVIAKGVGHLYGTSLPVGGEGTHAVMTSHTGMSNATLFDNLDKVVEGDLIFFDVYGETLAYKVDQIKVVLPDEIGDLVPVAGKDYVTLFTCTPYAVNSHRLLVRAERVDYTADIASQDVEESSFQLESWMWWLIGAAAAGLLFLLAVLLRERRKRKAAKRAAAEANAARAMETWLDVPPASDDSGAPHAQSALADSSEPERVADPEDLGSQLRED